MGSNVSHNQRHDERHSFALGILQDAMEYCLPRLWAQNRIFTETGMALDFADRPWLRQIYDDTHTRIAVQKAAQVGMTTWAYLRAIHRVALYGQTAIYTMPTEGEMRDFVSGRINRIIDNSAYLMELSGRSNDSSVSRKRRTDNTRLKQVGRGTLYFKGTQTGHGAISVPAQLLIHDELDFSNQEILEMYSHRLDGVAPAERQVYELSTPSIAGYGINAKYASSDGRQWLVKCGGCSWRGPLDYWEHTDGHLPYLRCSKCGSNLDARCGEWVAANPGRDVHGYHVSRLMLSIPTRPDILLDLHRKRNISRYNRHFTNMDLGLPSEDGVARMTSEQILGAVHISRF